MTTDPDFIRARTARHRRLAEIGDGGADRLAGARVAVVGAGGLGSTVIPYLAAAGVGRIDVFDDDVVELSNLNRQILHSADSIGQPKVTSAIVAGERLAPEVEVVGHQLRLGENFVDVVGAVRPDIVVDGSDSFDTRFVVDDGAARLGVPVVFGALMQWSAQITVFDAAGTYGPAVRLTDIFPDTPEVRATPGCAEMGILGSVAGMVGTMLATETIKLIVGTGRNLVGRMLVVDALEMQVTEIPLAQVAPEESGPAQETSEAAQETSGAAEDKSGPAQQKSAAVSKNPEATPQEHVRVTAVSTAVLDQDNPPVVIDVRRAEEVAQHPAPIRVVHVPFDQLDTLNSAGTLGEAVAPGSQIVTLCRTGPRSVRAAQTLAQAGYQVVGYLDGGVEALQSEVRVQ